ncbi:hypothetical protein OFO10_06045 [Campylobacter sp. VBCF_06 NA8]|uniref:hypothetical protein n=1 Tax=Campylobacter sp. VBCF_06 NA8 TaxID=2983822 RepID=UPI0022E9D28C|nr:hypothetical protein [Campylobacter sp. VBCF_06 NA8]MDA3046716.1 hypothetical protein [Campylobacter sp. VBCF_06 NA8]
MSENSPFDLIVESIGLESALKLAKDLGGYTFYIPKLNTLNITLEILELKKRGYNKEQILTAIKAKFELSHKRAIKILSKSQIF